LLFFGILRRYKGLESLLRAFNNQANPTLTLHIIGRPVDSELAADVTRAAESNPRIRTVIAHIPDDALAREIRSSTLVVLPYRDLYNSGALLLALSLNTPVLVPQTASTVALAQEVGMGWIHMFDGDLTSDHLSSAALAPRPSEAPNLDQRSWSSIGREYVDLYKHVGRRD